MQQAAKSSHPSPSWEKEETGSGSAKHLNPVSDQSGRMIDLKLLKRRRLSELTTMFPLNRTRV